MTSPGRKKGIFEKRKIVFDLFNGHCAYCGCKIDINNFEIDHKNSKKKGGNNNFDNLFPSCFSCNIIKKDRSIEEFKEYLVNIPNCIKNHETFYLLIKLGILRLQQSNIKFYFERII